MDKKLNEQMTEMTKCVLDNMMRLQEINDRTLQRLAHQQFEAAGDYMKTGVQRMKNIGESKDVKEAFSNQMELASELNDKMMTHAKQAMEMIAQSRNELSGVVEKGLASFMEMAQTHKD